MNNVAIINGLQIEDSTAREMINEQNEKLIELEELINSSSGGGTNNSNIKIVAGVARYQNGEWQLLNDSGHKPLNIVSIESDNKQQFKINYGFTANKVLSLVCGLDETYANLGFTCGASVGLDKSVINVSQQRELECVVNGNNGTPTATSTSEDIPVSTEVITHNSLGKYLKLTHSGIGAPPIILGLDKYDWKVLGHAGGYINLQAYLNGNKVGVPTEEFSFQYLRGPFLGAPKGHPEASNIWILGVFEVDE